MVVNLDGLLLSLNRFAAEPESLQSVSGVQHCSLAILVLTIPAVVRQYAQCLPPTADLDLQLLNIAPTCRQGHCSAARKYFSHSIYHSTPLLWHARRLQRTLHVQTLQRLQRK
jgi:hypothetical protein